MNGRTTPADWALAVAVLFVYLVVLPWMTAT